MEYVIGAAIAAIFIAWINVRKKPVFTDQPLVENNATQAANAWVDSPENKETDRLAVAIWERFDSELEQVGEVAATGKLGERIMFQLLLFAELHDHQAFERLNMHLDTQSRQNPERFKAYVICHEAHKSQKFG